MYKRQIVKRMNDVYAKFKAYVDAKPDKMCIRDRFDTFIEVMDYFKKMINLCKQMNDAKYKSEQYEDFKKQLQELVAERSVKLEFCMTNVDYHIQDLFLTFHRSH